MSLNVVFAHLEGTAPVGDVEVEEEDGLCGEELDE